MAASLISMKTTDASPCIDRRDFIGLAAGASALATLGPAASLFSPPAMAAAARGVQGEPLYWAWWGWEPLAHYRRMGRMVGGVDARSPTIEQWFDRLHSEPLAKQMAGLGINLAVTHFFKGFGLVAERAEQQRTATLVKFAHAHGIKVIGYCQSGSLYYEQFLAEQPRAAEWIKRDEKGELRTWGGAKFRWAPCILSREFRDYMKQAIRVGLQEVGLDGLHFDNDYSVPFPRLPTGGCGRLSGDLDRLAPHQDYLDGPARIRPRDRAAGGRGDSQWRRSRYQLGAAAVREGRWFADRPAGLVGRARKLAAFCAGAGETARWRAAGARRGGIAHLGFAFVQRAAGRPARRSGRGGDHPPRLCVGNSFWRRSDALGRGVCGARARRAIALERRGSRQDPRLRGSRRRTCSRGRKWDLR